jgi:hypothetical protein
VIGHVARQLQLMGQEERLAVGSLDLLQLDPGVLVGERDDVAPDRPPPEGDEHPMARHHLHPGWDTVGVVAAVEGTGRLNRNLGEPGQREPS